MKPLPHLLALILSAAPLLVLAQDAPKLEKPPLPEGPLIRVRAPEMARWVISSGPQAPVAETPPTDGEATKPPKGSWGSKIIVTKTGKIIRHEILDSVGAVWTMWRFQGTQITLWPDQKRWYVQKEVAHYDPDQPIAHYTDYSKTDFPGFEWIAAGNYQGIEKVAGHECLIFRYELDLGSVETSEGAAISTKIPVAAAINLATRLPAALTRGNDRQTFEFKEAPAAPLVPPAIVHSLLESDQKVVQASAPKQRVKAY